MPSIAPACLVVALITATLGCSTKKDEGPASEPEHARTAEQREKAKVEAQEAKQALQDYAYAQKAEFIAQMKKDLAETEQELDRLSAKVDESTGAAKADAKLKLDAVREQCVQAKRKIDEAEAATETTWDEVKVSARRSYGEMKESFDETRQWVSDKIEP